MCLEVQMLMHQKYGMSRIGRILFLSKSNNRTYLAVHNDGGTNLQTMELIIYNVQTIK